MATIAELQKTQKEVNKSPQLRPLIGVPKPVAETTDATTAALLVATKEVAAKVQEVRDITAATNAETAARVEAVRLEAAVTAERVEAVRVETAATAAAAAATVLETANVAAVALKDAELRATPVPVSGAVTTGDLTDAQLRATPVPTSVSNFPAVQPVDDNGGSLTVDNAGIFVVQPGPSTTGGLSTFHLVSAASTNATNIKASAGQVYGFSIYNNNGAALRKVVFHNTAGAPTAGVGVFFSIVIPQETTITVFSTMGIAFSAGIAITTVTGLPDSNATAVALNDLTINIWYS